MSTSKDERCRNFATIVYPDSAPSDWLDTLSSYHIPSFVSPLHDNDTNPNGESKKPHYHVMFMFEGNKSVSQIRDIFSSFGGVGVEKVKSLRGYARYLCHLDNPEKAQYSLSDVRCLCGADIFSIVNLACDRYTAIREMMFFCSENSIYSYAHLIEYAAINNDSWFRILCDSGTVVMKEYLKSLRWERLKQ